MRKLTQTKSTQISLYVILLTLFFGLNSQKTSAQCTDTLATFNSSTVQGSIKFVGVDYVYVSGKKLSTWFYLLNVKSGKSYGKDWSHTNFQIGSCMSSSMFDYGGTWTGTFANPTLDTNSCFSVGKDGSDPKKMPGIKYDCGLGDGTHKIWFRLKSDYDASSNTAKVKAGTPFDQARLCGPDTTCGVVPVTFGFISAVNVDGKDSIHWTTFTELNNERFVVERSYGGDDSWVEVGWHKGAGNSSQRIEYSVVVDLYEASATTRFYRVKQVDFDGKFEYSPIVKASSSPIFGFYPNPANEGQSVTFNLTNFDKEDASTLSVFNSIGKEVFTKNFTGSNIFELNELSKGVYSVRLNCRHFYQVEKLVIK